MSDLLKRMSDLIADFVQRETSDGRVVGILVFGSFVKGRIHRTSDLDLLVVKKDLAEWMITRQRERGIPLEVYWWPLRDFSKPFLGRIGNPFSDAFLFRVMRTGRILYDPKGILERFKRYAHTHRLPSSHVKWLVEKANESLRLARRLLKENELEGAELKVRRAAEELARAVLLERDIPEIIPPKAYLPRLRKEAPDFYDIFRKIHNLGRIQRNEVITAIQHISRWREKMVKEIRRIGKEDWLRPGGVIEGARTELSNALDCLENGDIEAAALQTRYSAIFVGDPILRLLQEKTAKNSGTWYVKILQSGHPYGEVLRSVMDFSYDERRLEGYIGFLGNLMRKYR